MPDCTHMDAHTTVDRLMAALNAHDVAAVRSLLAPDFVFEDAAGPGEGSIDAFGHELAMITAAFPDIDFRTTRLGADDKRTLVEFRAIGTHRGLFLSVPPTQALAIISGVFAVEIRGEQIAWLRLTINFADLRRQLLIAARTLAR